ncbi:MAG: RDD family protein [Beijerinckiaceae bacterium]
MSNIGDFDRSGASPFYPQLDLPEEALVGVRTRRILAVFIDFLVVSVLSSAIWLVLLVATLGWSLVLLPPLFPLVAFFYNGLSVSSTAMATPGMHLMDLEMRLADGSRVPFLYAAVHAVLFYVSWMFPPLLLISLVSPNKRCLHDILAGVVITRRPLDFSQ